MLNTFIRTTIIDLDKIRELPVRPQTSLVSAVTSFDRCQLGMTFVNADYV